jgi:hypothetical protein
MPLPNILKRASSYILGVQTGTPSPPPFFDGETIFCEFFSFIMTDCYMHILNPENHVTKNLFLGK